LRLNLKKAQTQDNARGINIMRLLITAKHDLKLCLIFKIIRKNQRSFTWKKKYECSGKKTNTFSFKL